MATLGNQQKARSDGHPGRGRLTKNDRLVLAALEDAGAPLKAYDLLERLKAQGIGAPMTVYRALDRLQKQGLVHKLDGMGAFMVCQHGEPHQLEAFLICTNCEKVEEIRDGIDGLNQLAHDAAARGDFTPELIRVEIRGLCHGCTEEQALN